MSKSEKRLSLLRRTKIVDPASSGPSNPSAPGRFLGSQSRLFSKLRRTVRPVSPKADSAGLPSSVPSDSTASISPSPASHCPPIPPASNSCTSLSRHSLPCDVAVDTHVVDRFATNSAICPQPSSPFSVSAGPSQLPSAVSTMFPIAGTGATLVSRLATAWSTNTPSFVKDLLLKAVDLKQSYVQAKLNTDLRDSVIRRLQDLEEVIQTSRADCEDMFLNNATLKRDLEEMTKALDENIESLKSIIPTQTNIAMLLAKQVEEQIKNAEAAIENARKRFQLRGNIAIRQGVGRLEVDVAAVSSEVSSIGTNLGKLSQRFESIPNLLAARSEQEQVFPLGAATSPTGTVPVVVSPVEPHYAPQYFFGRDNEFAYVVNALKAGPARMVIRGAVGMGKTTFTLAVMNDSALQHRFRRRLHFVNCDGRATLLAITTQLAITLGLPAASSLQAVRSHVAEVGPSLIVLDNLDTAWETSERHSVEDLLKSLTALQDLSLLVTMRGTNRPTDIRWTHPSVILNSLEHSACRFLYLEICPGCKVDDPDLDTLLQRIGGMPLAVKLMAAVGESGATPGTLLSYWDSFGTSLLTLGNTREYSLELSIKISLENVKMQDDRGQDAITLLSAIALLTGGMVAEEIPKLLPKLHGWQQALLTLQRTALIELKQQGSSTTRDDIAMLPAIRAYVLQYYSLREAYLAELIDYYFNPQRLNDFNFADEDNQASVLAASFTMFTDGERPLQVILNAFRAWSTRAEMGRSEGIDLLSRITAQESFYMGGRPFLEAALAAETASCPHTVATLKLYFALIILSARCGLWKFRRSRVIQSRRLVTEALELFKSAGHKAGDTAGDTPAKLACGVLLHIVQSLEQPDLSSEQVSQLYESHTHLLFFVLNLHPMPVSSEAADLELTTIQHTFNIRQDLDSAFDMLHEVREIWYHAETFIGELLKELRLFFLRWRGRNGADSTDTAGPFHDDDKRGIENRFETEVLPIFLQNMQLLVDILLCVMESRRGPTAPSASSHEMLVSMLESQIWEPLSLEVFHVYLHHHYRQGCLKDMAPCDESILVRQMSPHVAELVRKIQREQDQCLIHCLRESVRPMDEAHIDQIMIVHPGLQWLWTPLHRPRGQCPLSLSSALNRAPENGGNKIDLPLVSNLTDSLAAEQHRIALCPENFGHHPGQPQVGSSAQATGSLPGVYRMELLNHETHQQGCASTAPIDAIGLLASLPIGQQLMDVSDELVEGTSSSIDLPNSSQSVRLPPTGSMLAFAAGLALSHAPQTHQGESCVDLHEQGLSRGTFPSSTRATTSVAPFSESVHSSGGIFVQRASNHVDSMLLSSQNATVESRTRTRDPSQVSPPPVPPRPYLWTAFSALDSDSSGSISATELQQALLRLGWNVASSSPQTSVDMDTVNMLMTMFDDDHNGTITFDEFVNLWKYLKGWQDTFHRFDRDGSGSIDRQELTEALDSLGFNLSPELVSLLVRKYASLPIGDRGTQSLLAIPFDRFIRLCVGVSHLTKAFYGLPMDRHGQIQIHYDMFMGVALGVP